MLTLKKLEAMKPYTIFASGTLIDSIKGINLAGTGNEVRWVAVRGGIHDWCIYAQNPHYGNMAWSEEDIRIRGDKIHSVEYISKLVSCDQEAFKMYRH